MNFRPNLNISLIYRSPLNHVDTHDSGARLIKKASATIVKGTSIAPVMSYFGSVTTAKHDADERHGIGDVDIAILVHVGSIEVDF